MAWDQTPVSDAVSHRAHARTRPHLARGRSASTVFTQQRLALDFGYAHLFVKDASINLTRTQFGQTPATFTGTTRRYYEGSVDLLSLQLDLYFLDRTRQACPSPPCLNRP